MKNSDKSTTEFEANGIKERYEARRLPETEGSLPETSVNGILDQMFDIQEADQDAKVLPGSGAETKHSGEVCPCCGEAVCRYSASPLADHSAVRPGSS